MKYTKNIDISSSTIVEVTDDLFDIIMNSLIDAKLDGSSKAKIEVDIKFTFME